ncbi:MAG: ATP-grasp domain-containing protein [Thermodesulfobacteriota bacterium]
MVLSFHPCFRGDVNRLCAGRRPNAEDLAAIRAADAVILPQGCSRALHELARGACPLVFPDYTARFRYPGKIGQIRLFREINVPHPQTACFDKVSDFFFRNKTHSSPPPFSYPAVFKFDWGGGGDNVFLLASGADLENALEKAARYETSGQRGFLIQEYIPSGNRSLRAAVIGSRLKTYWRTGGESPSFLTNIAKGGAVDEKADPDLQARGTAAVRSFCRKTGINLAGFDLLFPANRSTASPLFLEINYYFGRRGLGGSERYYELLVDEIENWLRSVGLK